MPNAIKYNTSAETLALKKGNFWIGTGDVGKGPTTSTGFYNGISPPWYTIYLNTGAGPLIYKASDNTQLISLTNTIAGQTFTTVAAALNWYNSQTDKMVFNIDYPAIITDGLVLNLDAGFTPSYPTTGTTWYDVSSSGANGTLVGSPPFVSGVNDFGGSFTFNRFTQWVNLTTSSIFTNSSYTIETWQKYTNIPGGNAPFNSITVLGIVGSQSNTYLWIRITQDTDTGSITVYVENANQGTIVSTIESGVPGGAIWFQLVFTYNYSNNTAIIYANGVQNLSGTFQPFVGTSPTIQLGAITNYPSILWEGSFAASRFYNRALSAAEVLQNYNAEIAQQNALNAEYQEILNYATSLGYTLPSAGQRIKQNKLLVDLKTTEIWDKLDSFFVFQTDGDSNFALIDWKRLVTATAVNSPTFVTNTGFQGNATSSYIDMNFNPLTSKVNMSQDNATYGFYSNILASGASAYAIGTSLAYTRLAYSTGNNRVNSSNGGGGGNQNPGIGYNCMIRNSSTTVVTGRVDGTFTATGTNTSTPILSQSMYFLRQQTQYSAGYLGGGFIASAFNVTQWSSFVTTYTTYKNSL
jgi:hypothetical protein